MARRFRLAAPLALVLAVSLAACDGDGGPSGLDPDVYELVIVSGGDQSGLAGSVLEEPLVVRVRRIDTGAPEEGVTVNWSRVSGSAEPTRDASVTDEAGDAVTFVELGASAGGATIRATVAGLDPVNFASLTVLPAPTLVSVSPSAVDPGDTVTIQVADLPAAMAAEVLFDGVLAELAGRTDGAPAELRAIAPAPAGVCAAASVPVAVRVRVDALNTAPDTISVSVPADPFQVGQVLVLEGAGDVGCALLPAGGGTARYLLVALSAELETAGMFEVTLGASTLQFAPAGVAPPAAAPDFYSGLRAIERRLAARGLGPARAAAGPAPQLLAEPQVGDRRSFWVVDDLDAVNSGDLTEEAFTRVTATLQFVGGNTLLYVDNAAPSPGLTAADLQSMGELYDRRLYDADVDYFGAPTDVDDNGRVVVLLSPVVNSLTPRGADGMIVGFFFGLDLFPPSTPGCPECEFSNGSEIFYGFVPDPNGVYSDPRTRTRVLELLPGVMVHETQHMISFRYKIFESPDPDLEILWLSEAMAHMAEEKGGDLLYDAGELSLADDLYASNFDRALSYVEAPYSYSLTATDGTGSLGERGGWWLFLRWLGEHYGDFVFRPLTQEPEVGVANVEARTGESFFRLLADFSVALWADDLEIAGLPERYQIPKWPLRDILLVEGTSTYALQPLPRTFAQLRSTPIVEFMAGTSPLYVEVNAAGNTNALQLQLDGEASFGLVILRYQ